MQSLQSLARQMQLRQINAQEFHQAVVQTIIQRIGSTRASVWYFNEYKDALTCAALYDARTEEFSSGFTLYAEEYPEYFRAMVEGDTIVAVDAMRHPLTACFAETYFDPMDIKSLLDISIIVKGEVVGVVCCEHCEHRKAWSQDDIRYLNIVASALSLTKPLMQAEEEV